MNKIITVIMCTTCLASCSSGGDITTVKNGVLDFNKTLTIGQALDNWRDCKKSEWSEFTSDNGVKVVQFACDEKIEEYMSTLRSFLPENDPSLSDLPDSDTETFQFTLNKDGTFQLDNVSNLMKWKDGTEYENSQTPMDELKSAYQNEISYNMSDFNGLQKGNGDSQAAAEEISVVFELAKARGEKPANTSQEPSQKSTPVGVPPETPASTTPSSASPSIAKAPGAAVRDSGTLVARSIAGTGAICEEGSNGIPALGATYQDGIYLCREHVEEGYWNDWYASRSKPQQLHVESDGKTSGFEGDLTINCSASTYSWADATEFSEPLTSDKDIAGVVPRQVVTNAIHYVCKG